MHKSFLGSVKNELFRKPTRPLDESTTHSDKLLSNNPFAAPPAAVEHANPSSQPPPAYTVTAPAQSSAAYLEALDGPAKTPSAAPSNTGVSVSTPEDPYAFLSSFDTIFIVDDSGSMAGRSWPEVQNVLRAITPICTSHDDDGIDLYFLNNKTSDSGNARAGKAAGGYYGIRRAETVQEIFTTVRPRGATPTGQRLHAILRSYLQLLESKKHDVESVKPINIIVITDGAPSDDVEFTIISAAKKLDKLDAPMHQVGVQFFQIGNEPGAREALRELDDDLVGRIDGDLRDMVDTVTWENGNRGVLTAESILKVVLGAVVRRLDRHRTKGS